MSDEPKKRWFQFTLETSLIVVTAIAIAMALFRNASSSGSGGWTYWLAAIALCFAFLDPSLFRGSPVSVPG